MAKWQLAVLGVAAGAAAAILVVALRPAHPGASAPSTSPTTNAAAPAGSTAPATVLATAPTATPAAQPVATTPPVVAAYRDFVAAVQPALRDVEPLTHPVALDTAAALASDNPLYIDGRGDLWISHPDAPPLAQSLPTASKSQVHLTREAVVYAWWARDGRGRWVCQPVTHQPNTTEGGNSGRYVWHTTAGPVALGQTDYRFDAVLRLRDGRLAVPTGGGVSAFTVSLGAVTEAFKAVSTGRTPVVVTGLAQGALAYRPWQNGDPGSERVYRLLPVGTAKSTAEGAGKSTAEGTGGTEGESGDPWVEIKPEKFPERPFHVLPLTDGSNLVLSAAEDGGVDLELLLPFDRTPVDEPAVLALVEQLSRPDPAQRRDAQARLSQFGPSAWPVLERVHDAATPEVQEGLDRLQAQRFRPTLGIFTPLPGPVRVLARSPEGGVILKLDGGVKYVDLRKEIERSPAVLTLIPGQTVRFFSDRALDRKDVDTLRLDLRGDEVIQINSPSGPARLLSNHFSPLLRPEFKAYTTWLGTDREGRWLFRRPDAEKYLLVDPVYSDSTPRLPVWILDAYRGLTGWDEKGRPVVRREDGEAWTLDRSAWTLLSSASSRPSGGSALAESPGVFTAATPDQDKAQVRVVLPDGRVAWAGRGVVTIESKDGRVQRVELPPPPGKRRKPFDAREIDPPFTRGIAGDALQEAGRRSVFRFGRPRMVVAGGRLFVFDVPGRVVRLSSSGPTGAFSVDAAFTANIPDLAVRRVWVDPFGRICVASGQWGLTVLFPEGRIPPDIASIVTAPPDDTER